MKVLLVPVSGPICDIQLAGLPSDYLKQMVERLGGDIHYLPLEGHDDNQSVLCFRAHREGLPENNRFRRLLKEFKTQVAADFYPGGDVVLLGPTAGDHYQAQRTRVLRLLNANAWNHRVVLDTANNSYAVCEVFHDADGKIMSWTDPCSVGGFISLEDLRTYLTWMLHALDYPVVRTDDPDLGTLQYKESL